MHTAFVICHADAYLLHYCPPPFLKIHSYFPGLSAFLALSLPPSLLSFVSSLFLSSSLPLPSSFPHPTSSFPLPSSPPLPFPFSSPFPAFEIADNLCIHGFLTILSIWISLVPHGIWIWQLLIVLLGRDSCVVLWSPSSILSNMLILPNYL